MTAAFEPAERVNEGSDQGGKKNKGKKNRKTEQDEGEASPVKTSDECTQVAVWRETRVEGTPGADPSREVPAPGMVYGRNMDMECDLRRVTVTHLATFVVCP